MGADYTRPPGRIRRVATNRRGNRLGRLPPRYTFLLNPHAESRLSRCPACDKLTHARKFPLLISIDTGDFITLGKTCKYCSRCEMVMCDQDQLEAELAHAFATRSPEVLGREYFVVGTVDRKTWQSGLRGKGDLDQLVEHAADFKHYRGLSITPGGWYAAGHEPAPLPATRPQVIPRDPPVVVYAPPDK
jgi:hypothetical protein